MKCRLHNEEECPYCNAVETTTEPRVCLNYVLSGAEKALLNNMMSLYSRERMCVHRDYDEEDAFDSIKKKLLGPNW